MVFLEADDATLVRRFEQVRRPHPLQGDGRILDGIAEERDLLGDLRGRADILIDTSRLNVHELAHKMAEAFTDTAEAVLRVTVLSFGFKYGVPVDADHVADVRFLPNPFWVPELRPHTGLDEPVSRLRARQSGAGEFLERYTHGADPGAGGLRPREQALRHHRRRLHRRQAPLGGHDRGTGGTTARRRRHRPHRPP